uniref:Putative electron transfer oxidoreductase n=1 Tax=uncultured bacterium contig00006 TaxID=1181498 RepID=A0A806JZ89_9BACT|nr:putative electron transfer oxidoreductase [uncultured bacterium contig00006]
MKKRDVIIVGAGIGGSSAAWHMKQAGIDPLLVEKEQFPRDKPCGDGILAALFPMFEMMGVLDEVLAAGQKTSGFTRFYNTDEDFFQMANPDAAMYCCPRYKFDDIMNKNAIRAGVDYIENFEVVDLLMRRQQVVGVQAIHNGRTVEIESNLVVLACGSHFLPSRKLGFYEEDPEYVFYGLRGYFENVGNMEHVEFYYPDHFMPSGYIWIFPVSKTMGNVGVFITESALRKSGKTTEELLWDWAKNTKYGKERLGGAELIGKLKGWRLPSGKHKPIHAGGVIAVGDAGNMIEAFGGGGIPQAISAGMLAAQTAREAIDAGDFSKDFLNHYNEAVEGLFGATYKAMEGMRAAAFTTSDQLRELTKYMNGPEADLSAWLKEATGGEVSLEQLASHF